MIFLPGDAESHAILIGAVAIALVGVLDDVFDLPAAVKLLGQTAAVVIPVSAGVTVDNFTFPFLGRLDPGNRRPAAACPAEARSTSATSAP